MCQASACDIGCENDKRYNKPRVWDYESVCSYLESFGYFFLNKTFTRTRDMAIIKCPNGHIYSVTLSHFINKGYRCQYCRGKPTYESIKEYIENNGYKLLSKKYVDSTTPLYVECDKGHRYKVIWNKFKFGRRCMECYLDSKYKDGNINWKGGITELNRYLRETLGDWKFKSLECYNFRCSITQIKRHDLCVHHLQSFNTIVNDVLHDLKLPIKQNICDYSVEELKSIKEDFLKQHHNLLGVPMCKELHKLFHQQYGHGNNTLEQFEEFKTRLKSGEFNTFLEENNLKLVT